MHWLSIALNYALLTLIHHHGRIVRQDAPR